MGTYSEGVRQALWHHHHNRSGFKVVGKSATYTQDYLTSQFCAAPLGEVRVRVRVRARVRARVRVREPYH